LDEADESETGSANLWSGPRKGAGRFSGLESTGSRYRHELVTASPTGSSYRHESLTPSATIPLDHAGKRRHEGVQ
jgi:hypothetical protein